jgi:hypothetical protein
MNEKQWRAFGEWCMEISALVAVFPALELLVKEGRFHLSMMVPVVCALLVGWIGLYLLGRS